MSELYTIGSMCSGMEAASVALNPLGFKTLWLSEIDAAPCSVLANHHPTVPNLGDMRKIPALIRDCFVPAPDMLCGGTPCQAFSIAGLRNSLDDERGNLSLIFCETADEIDKRRAADGLLPAVILWENVPGVLSTADNAFGCFLAGLAGEDDPIEPPGAKWSNAGCVYGPKRTVAWRVLDAQYFGVAQRRRRVFVVASARKGFDPGEVLFEFDGVRRDSAPASRPYPTIDCGIWRKRQCNQWIRNGFAIARSGRISNPTVIEVERMFGFPDHYTDVPGVPLVARYAMLGNIWAVPNIVWIGKRIRAALDRGAA